MRKTIDKLRSLPIKERRSLLHFSMIVCSLIVFSLWTLTLKYDLQSPETRAALEQSAEPFIDFGSQMAGTYNALKDSANNNDLDNTSTSNVTELKSTLPNGQR